MINSSELSRGEASLKVSHHGISRLRFGQFEADLLEGKLFNRGVPVRIENQPFQILVALLERPGEVISREELRTRLWPSGTYVDFDEGLNTAISKLRYALRDSAEIPIFVETVPRRGYRFLAPVSDVTAGKAAPGNVSHPVPVAIPANEPHTVSFSVPDAARNSPGRSHPTFPNRSMLAASLITLLVLVVTGIWAAHRWRTPASQNLNREAMEIRKLADTSNADEVAISPDGRFVVYARRIGEKVSLRMRQMESGGDVEVLSEAEVDFVGLTFSPDGNYLYFARSDKDDPGYKYLYVMPALGGPFRKLITDIDSPVSFSPDGRKFVFTRGLPMKNQVEVRIANSDGTSEHLLKTMEETNAGYQPGATWSPDGRTIAVPVFHRGRTVKAALYAVSVADGSQRELYSTDGFIGRASWNPDGSSVLVTLRERNLSRGQLWKVSFPSGKRERITNDLSNYDLIVGTTPDGKDAVTVETTLVENIWASPVTDSSQLEQITFDESPMREVVETSSGKLLVVGRSELWIMNGNGTARALFAKLDADQVCASGTFVVARVLQDGLEHIVRLNGDGTHATTLAVGNLYSPTCSPDGKTIFYVDATPPQRILKMSIEGGTSVEIAKIPGDGIVGQVNISNDGKFLAYPWEQYNPIPAVHLSVISTEGSLVKSFKAPSGVYEMQCLRWSPADTALQYILARNGVANIWQQSLAGGAPQQVTKFTSGLIFHFNRAKSDKRLLMARGSVTSDAVLISHLR